MDLKQVRANLHYDTPLYPNDPLWVELGDVRGSFREQQLLFDLCGSIDGELLDPPDSRYILFGGHRGCGKSTELRHLADKLGRPDGYFVVFVDVLAVLDINNLRYSDVLLALATALAERLQQANVSLHQVFLDKLESWFKEHIETYDETRQWAAGIRAGAKAQHGIPFIAQIFGALTTSIKTNTTYKESVRVVVRNTFSQFAEAFNAMIEHAEAQIREAGQGGKILFIVDGTDRLHGEDSRRFFIADVHQLRLVHANFIYCAPIDLLCESGALNQNFDRVVRLPMIKLMDKHTTQPEAAAYARLRELVSKRMDATWFDSTDTVDYLITLSGGHVRDLIRLLNYCLLETYGKPIDRPAAEAAVKELATEYRRLIQPEDYAELYRIDLAPKPETPATEQTRRLLYNLVLLEYNAYWWRSHPLVSTLEAYRLLAAS